MINWSTIIVSVISFSLGLLGNLFVQWVSDRKRLERIEGALRLHLQDIILKECVTMKLEFNRTIDTIKSISRESIDFKDCKTFDAEIYKANNPSDYYKIYGSNGKFGKLVSTYAIISFLKDKMPFKIYSNYLAEIDQCIYLDFVDGLSPNQRFRESAQCENLRVTYISTCRMLINEIEMLTNLINEFIQ